MRFMSILAGTVRPSMTQMITQREETRDYNKSTQLDENRVSKGIDICLRFVATIDPLKVCMSEENNIRHPKC